MCLCSCSLDVGERGDWSAPCAACTAGTTCVRLLDMCVAVVFRTCALGLSSYLASSFLVVHASQRIEARWLRRATWLCSSRVQGALSGRAGTTPMLHPLCGSSFLQSSLCCPLAQCSSLCDVHRRTDFVFVPSRSVNFVRQPMADSVVVSRRSRFFAWLSRFPVYAKFSRLLRRAAVKWQSRGGVTI